MPHHSIPITIDADLFPLYPHVKPRAPSLLILMYVYARLYPYCHTDDRCAVSIFTLGLKDDVDG